MREDQTAPGRRDSASSALIITERLALIVEWYRGMICEETGRLVYTYDPERERVVVDGSPIRDIASVWDAELLGRFLARSELLPLVRRSVEYYSGWLVARDGALILDTARLGEPSGIAHSAFMMLALLDSDSPGREAKVRALAEGLLDQQREDGSYRVYFGGEADSGLEFYPGEAMLALMRAHALAGDPRYLASVARGFGHYRRRFPAAAVAADLQVFFANWQSQYAALLHEHTPDPGLKRAVRDYLFELHDRILDEGFAEQVERHPLQQATVEVACALEGLNDAWSIAAREQDGPRVERYGRAIRVVLAWLLGAQRLVGCTSRERGGFGHSLTNRTQRIDVTGHVVSGFIKCAQNQVGA